MKFTLLFLLTVAAFPQPASSPITADLRAEYWQAWGDDADARRVLAEAQIAAFQKRANLGAVIDKLRKQCEERQQQLIERPDRQPDCAAPPPVSSTKGAK